MTLPFRWNLARREQLGHLAQGEEAPSYPELVDDLRECCARVLALSGDCDLVFVGRSPESVFDHLGGLLLDTSWAPRLTLVNVSLRGASDFPPEALRALREQLAEAHLSPEAVATRERGVAFVDLVATGGTFGRLAAVLLDWARDVGVDESAVRRRVRFTGITWRTHTSPNTIRWHQRAEWTRQFPPSAIKNASIDGRLWGYLGNLQQKVSPSNTPWRWATDELLSPPRASEHVKALRLALRLFDTGREDALRERFAERLAQERAMREPWFRSLVLELRGRSPRSR